MHSRSNNMHSVLVYDAAISNLGDIFQTIALASHLPQTNGIYREDLKNFEQTTDFLIANGLIHELPHINEHVLFAGAHFFPGTGIFSKHNMKEHLLKLKNSPHAIGARDPATHKKLEQAGVKTEMIGCSTLTFEPYKGQRKGTYSVEFNGPGIRLTHKLPMQVNTGELWRRALERLNIYRTAERVYTTRLHAALPCLAFGTPVCFVPPMKKFQPSRYSLLQHLGVEYGKLTTLNTEKMKKTYLGFLRKHMQITANKEPLIPLIKRIARPNPIALKLAYHARNI